MVRHLLRTALPVPMATTLPLLALSIVLLVPPVLTAAIKLPQSNAKLVLTAINFSLTAQPANRVNTKPILLSRHASIVLFLMTVQIQKHPPKSVWPGSHVTAASPHLAWQGNSLLRKSMIAQTVHPVRLVHLMLVLVLHARRLRMQISFSVQRPVIIALRERIPWAVQQIAPSVPPAWLVPRRLGHR